MGDRILHKIVSVRENETRATILSFLYFFCLLAGYYTLRPLREEMGRTTRAPVRRVRSVDDEALPITEHLSELRKRLAWMFGAIAIAAMASFSLANRC